MFSGVWISILCFSIPILANMVTFKNMFYRICRHGKALKMEGWMILLIGNVVPLVSIFYTAARAGRTDEGIHIGGILGIGFLVRVAYELGNIARMATDGNDGS